MSVPVADIAFDSLADAEKAQRIGQCRICTGDLKVQAEGGRFWLRCLHSGHRGLVLL